MTWILNPNSDVPQIELLFRTPSLLTFKTVRVLPSDISRYFTRARNMNNPRNPVTNVDLFMRNRHQASSRYASYDHCFNYFQEFRDRPAALASAGQRQLSCLHLGYYLASWGMFRGKAALLQHSSRALVPSVELISAAPMSIWTTDVESYNERRINELIDFKNALSRVVPGGRSGTLTSKIMLGTFGCVPAFDRFFCEGFDVSGFRRGALQEVYDYYVQHQEMIESCREKTINFDGEQTNIRYTQAKVIDMIFFVEGQNLASRRQREHSRTQ